MYSLIWPLQRIFPPNSFCLIGSLCNGKKKKNRHRRSEQNKQARMERESRAHGRGKQNKTRIAHKGREGGREGGREVQTDGWL